MRAALPDSRGHRRLLAALTIDALGTGLFLPFSILYFTATTTLSLGQVGLALSIAAFVRIPATAGAGMFTDRFSARTMVIVSNVAQAIGFVNYLFVGSFGHLVVAAVIVQVGNSAFWVAYPALVHDVADEQSQERWFGLISAVRNAGLAVGAVGASVAVAIGGRDGYTAIVEFNAISFAVAAILTMLDRPEASRAKRRQQGSAAGAWAGAFRDRPFLGFVVLNVGFALLFLAFIVAVPVFLVRTAHLPQWTPGAILGLNAVLGAIGATVVVTVINGRRRNRTLMSSQAIIGACFVAVLCCAYVPPAASVGLALLASVLITATELIQGPVVPSIVNDCATGAGRGRYNSLYQMAFSIGDIVAPTLMTTLLAHGPVATWLPLVALAGVDMIGIVLLSRRLPALRGRIGQGDSSEPDTSRLIEADGR